MHTGPYTIKFVMLKNGRENLFVRKTFKAAENVASTMFRREALQSVTITNIKGSVYSRYNFARPSPNEAPCLIGDEQPA